MLYDPLSDEAKRNLRPRGIFGAIEIAMLRDGKWACVYRKRSVSRILSNVLAGIWMLMYVVVLLVCVL